MQHVHPNTAFAAHSVGGGEVFFKEGISMDTLLEIQEGLRKESFQGSYGNLRESGPIKSGLREIKTVGYGYLQGLCTI